MPIGSERTAVQNPFLCYAQEAGWTYLTPDEALRLRPGPTSPILLPVLVQQPQTRREDPRTDRRPGAAGRRQGL